MSTKQIDDLVNFAKVNQVVTTKVTLPTGVQTVVAAANPLRLFVAFDIPNTGADPKFIPIGPKSSQQTSLGLSGNQPNWTAFDLNKHHALCTCEWDYFNNGSQQDMIVVEVIYGGS